MSINEFSGKTVLVTGGSSGIGLASAKAMLQRGAKHVFINGRDQSKLDRVKEELGEAVTVIQADLSKVIQIQAMAKTIQNTGLQIDVLFANAGIAENNEILSTSEEQFDATFDTNVKAVFFTVQAMLPLMRDGGNIILNASVASNKGMNFLSLYSASKAAVRSFARTWCNDLKERKIRVNAISPGVTATPILKTGLKMSDEYLEEFKTFLATAVPTGRMADAEEIANAVCFLASDQASFVNGIELCVDGGFTQI